MDNLLIEKYIGEARKKFPDGEPLGVKGIEPNMLARAETVGAINYVMPEFKKQGVTHIDGAKFKLSLKNGELWVIWTPKGKSMLKTRMKENNTYYEDVVKVFKEAYKNYSKKI